jgi:hypothetical protein
MPQVIELHDRSQSRGLSAIQWVSTITAKYGSACVAAFDHFVDLSHCSVDRDRASASAQTEVDILIDLTWMDQQMGDPKHLLCVVRQCR